MGTSSKKYIAMLPILLCLSSGCTMINLLKPPPTPLEWQRMVDDANTEMFQKLERDRAKEQRKLEKKKQPPHPK